MITECDSGQCRHIRKILNIADIATRGAAALDHKPESRCIKWPDLLTSDESEWPVDDIACSALPTAEVEMKKKVLRVEVQKQKLLDPAA